MDESAEGGGVCGFRVGQRGWGAHLCVYGAGEEEAEG